jgi:starvation-inducible outer membrane lipoprotein
MQSSKFQKFITLSLATALSVTLAACASGPQKPTSRPTPPPMQRSSRATKTTTSKPARIAAPTAKSSASRVTNVQPSKPK